MVSKQNIPSTASGCTVIAVGREHLSSVEPLSLFGLDFLLNTLSLIPWKAAAYLQSSLVAVQAEIHVFIKSQLDHFYSFFKNCSSVYKNGRIWHSFVSTKAFQITSLVFLVG